MRNGVLCLVAILCLSSNCFGERGLRFEQAGKQQTILPLGYTSQTVLALNRNGYLLRLRPDEIENPQVVPRFRPFSQSEARGELLREFGKRFEVTGTGNYLIVHPRGKRDLWANRFEELYRSMTHFFKRRGYPMQRPQFPLVGIVFYSQGEYLEYNRRVLRSNASHTYGVYMPDTNRIYLYDATKGTGARSSEWEENLATVMHESAHQTAFNTGIHRRACGNPRWVVEGLGCLFEARGIYNSSQFKNQGDRINYGRLMDFKQYVTDDAQQVLSSMVASDRAFQRDAHRCYAAAWALTFYLSEREPTNYMKYLRMVAKHGPFDSYDSTARSREFASAFGGNYQMLAARVTRFIDDLPIPKS